MKRLTPKIKKEEQVKAEPKITIEYNNFEEKFYLENALTAMPDPPLNHNINKFLAAIDPSKPIKRKVSRMYRVKELDFITDYDKPKRREFLLVMEDWFGKRVDGTEVSPIRDHKNGVYNELMKNPDGSVRPTQNKIYYIPFNKENVDEWIEQSYSTDQESIQFWVDTREGNNRKQFDYNEFVYNTWEELVNKVKAKPSDSKAINDLTEIVKQQQEQIDQLLKVKKK